MRNSNKNISMKDSRKTMINNTISKLKTIIAMGALVSLSACTGYTSHSSEVGSEIPSYPVIQF